MFIDFLTLMLINMAVALVLFALYMAFYFEKNSKKMIPGFLMVGFIALATGLRTIFTWPLPGSYNILFGELTVMLGAIFFMAGLAILFDWNLITVGIFSLFTGAVAVLLGVRILDMQLTQEPLVAAVGYILTGATAILTLPAIALPKLKWLRWLTALAAICSAVIWALVGLPSYWAHIDSFSKWAPGGPK